MTMIKAICTSLSTQAYADTLLTPAKNVKPTGVKPRTAPAPR